MDSWPVMVGVLLLGGLVALAALVWPWLDPLSPARATEKLLAVLSTWNGVRDFAAQVAVRGAEGETLARILFLTPGNLRIDVLAPEGLAGEVFALRPVSEGWLFVHYRPWIDLGIEARILASELESSLNLPTMAQTLEGIRRGQVRVSYVPAPTDNAFGASPGDEFDVRGLPGQFPRIVLRVDPATSLPRE
ncbi:MAG: hypothetical protein ABID40_05635, partial [Candidatus Bipolaricaulota bacterium]